MSRCGRLPKILVVPAKDLANTASAELRSLREEMVDSLLECVEEVVEALYKSKVEYEMTKKICDICDRVKPPETKKCGHCGSTSFRPEMCTKESRMDFFHQTICTRAIWRFSVSSKETPRTLVRNLRDVSHERIYHQCDGSEDCPLKSELRNLKGAIDIRIMEWDGISLRDVKTECSRHVQTMHPENPALMDKA